MENGIIYFDIRSYLIVEKYKAKISLFLTKLNGKFSKHRVGYKHSNGFYLVPT